jgi:hypothetical protein
MRIFLFILGLAASLFFCGSAAAQEVQNAPFGSEDVHPGARYDYLGAAYYKRLTAMAMLQDPGLDFSFMRSMYTRTLAYDPFSEDVQRKILVLSETVHTSKDKQEIDKALKDYDALVMAHLANIDVVEMARLLSKDDKRFGDTEVYEWIHDGLLLNILNSGNGNTLSGAYDVVTFGEAEALMKALKVDVLAVKNVRESIVYYDMYDVGDPATGQTRTVFVNTSKPMRFAEWQKSRQKSSAAIPKR